MATKRILTKTFFKNYKINKWFEGTRPTNTLDIRRDVASLCTGHTTKLLKSLGKTPQRGLKVSLFKTKPNSKHIKIWLKDTDDILCYWGTSPRCCGRLYTGTPLNLENGEYYVTLTPIK